MCRLLERVTDAYAYACADSAFAVLSVLPSLLNVVILEPIEIFVKVDSWSPSASCSDNATVLDPLKLPVISENVSKKEPVE